MNIFEPEIYGVGSDCSSNCATTTAHRCNCFIIAWFCTLENRFDWKKIESHVSQSVRYNSNVVKSLISYLWSFHNNNFTTILCELFSTYRHWDWDLDSQPLFHESPYITTTPGALVRNLIQCFFIEQLHFIYEQLGKDKCSEGKTSRPIKRHHCFFLSLSL